MTANLMTRHGLAAVLALAGCTEPAPGGAPADLPVVERICYSTEPDFLHVTHLRVNGTSVDLYCGDRFAVEQGRCVVERDTDRTEVACTVQARSGGDRRRPVGAPRQPAEDRKEVQ